MKLQDLDAQHSNPDHWYLIFFYFAPDDPRILVKKRIAVLGWTLNFSRPIAIPFLCTLVALVYGYMKVADFIVTSSQGHWLSVFLLVVLIVSLCGWMSNPQRYTSKSEQDAPSDGDTHSV